MALFLDRREGELEEQMDNPNCNRIKLFNTYRQFKYINRLISRWRYIYKREIRPYLSRNTPTTLLDIGFGGGDLSFALHRWAVKEEGLQLNITAIDNDSRALDFIQKQPYIPEDIQFLHTDAFNLKDENRSFDFVISNHLLHHLSRDSLPSFCQLVEELCNKRVIFNDLRRSFLAYGIFTIFIGPFFRNSFAAEDGRRSIRRSYTREELECILPSDWKVERKFPYRLIATYSNE